MPPQRLQISQLEQWFTSTTTTTITSTDIASFAIKLPEPNNGSELHHQPQHPSYLQTLVLSILHNGSMINEIQTVRQPEDTELTIYCDSIGGWSRFVFFIHTHTAKQNWTILINYKPERDSITGSTFMFNVYSLQQGPSQW